MIYILLTKQLNAKYEKVRELKLWKKIWRLLLFIIDLSFFFFFFSISKFLEFLSRKWKGNPRSRYELAKPPNLHAIFDPLSAALSNKLAGDTSREEWTLSLSLPLLSMRRQTHRGSASVVHRRWKERGPRRNKFQPVKTARWLTRD